MSTEDQKAMKQQAAYEKALTAAETEPAIIERLLDSPGWKWFVARINTEANPIVERLIADENLTEQETKLLRRVLRTLKEVTQIPESDLTRHRQFIERHNRDQRVLRRNQ